MFKFDVENGMHSVTSGQLYVCFFPGLELTIEGDTVCKHDL